MDNSNLTRWLRLDEGAHLRPYVDTRGNWTIGTGHLITDPVALAIIEATPDAHISPAAHNELLAEDIRRAELDASHLFGVVNIGTRPGARRDALVNLAFDLGFPALSRFVGLQAAVARGAWSLAAGHILWRDPTTRPLVPTPYAEQTAQNAARIARAVHLNIYPWDSHPSDELDPTA